MMDDAKTAVMKTAFGCRDNLLAYAYALLRDWPMADDVLQEAFLVVMDKWETVEPGPGVVPWVRQIVRYKAMEAARARRRERPAAEPELFDTIADAMDERLDSGGDDEQQIRLIAMRECMKGLDEEAVGMLAGFYGRSEACETLASSFGRSVNAVRLRLSRVRVQLRECIDRRLAHEA